VKEVTSVTKARLVYLLVIAAILVSILGLAMAPFGMADGGQL
jgi:hypothetical protein